MATALYRRCEYCTGGCFECQMTGYLPALCTLEQVRKILDSVPDATQLQLDLDILKHHNAAYAAENERLRAIINEGQHASSE